MGAAGSDDLAGVERRHRDGPARPEVARPERPDLSNTTPAPLLSVTTRPRAAGLTLRSWSAALLLLTFGAVTMLLTRTSISAHLAELLRERDASVDAASVDTASTRIVFALLAATVLVTVAVGMVLRSFSRRRRWPRLLMVPAWLLVASVAGVASLVVPTTGWQGWLLLGSVGLSVLILLVGSLAAWGPGVTQWLRASHEGHPRGS